MTVVIFSALLLLIVLPLAGAWLAGHDLARYLEFPPLTRHVTHADFSWPVFIGLAAIGAAFLLPFIVKVLKSRRTVTGAPPAAHSFPWWGWSGLLLGLAAWVLGWTRFDCVAFLQLYTFTPLWLAYIVVINAFTFRRTGRCLLTHRRRYLLSLFPLSALFWWFFEYLNRFVQNWYYLGVKGFSGLEYFLLSSLAFSTVLPAVLSTGELLESMPRAAAGLDRFVPIRVKKPRLLAWMVLIVSGLGLAGIGIWPNVLFPLLWLAPLLIITSLQALRGRETIFSPLGRGDWTRLYRLALAALMCGFFWEMWNYFSLAKWVYEIPFVYRFTLFEMPILGYGGYLPFGLECAVIADLLKKQDRQP